MCPLLALLKGHLNKITSKSIYARQHATWCLAASPAQTVLFTMSSIKQLGQINTNFVSDDD
jgi:hypothetical protein